MRLQQVAIRMNQETEVEIDLEEEPSNLAGI